MSSLAPAAGADFPPELDVDGPGRQRRLTVLVRILLLIPQYIILYALSLAASIVAVIGWFAALVMGRLPQWAAEFLSAVVGYMTRVAAYNMLLVDRYPPVALNAPEYPVRIHLQPGRLNRLAVFFRFILIIPAAIVSNVLLYGWMVCSFFCWLAVLIVGRTPRPVFDATVAVARYYLRYQAYYFLLTGEYPKHVFGDPEPAPGAAADGAGGTRPLVLSSGGRALLVVFSVVGVLSIVAYIVLMINLVLSTQPTGLQPGSGLSAARAAVGA